MNMRSRCFPLEYYPGEILTEVEARRRRKHLIVLILLLGSLWASNLEVHQIESETNGFQPRTEIHKVVHDLRGGINATEVAWLVITIWMLQQQSVGFQPVRPAPPPHHQLFGGTVNPPKNNHFSKSSQSGTSLQLEKPSFMSHPDFNALNKEQRRNLPDARDGVIDVVGHPKLNIRYGQVIYKMPKHGKIHGLPTNENDKTPKTEENALALRDSLVKMPERKGIVWFENGGYQKGTKRGYDSVNLYDEKSGIIAIFKKQENGEYLFSTTCEVTVDEHEHLYKTNLYKTNGNFVTQAVLNNLND